jgi:molecular chaperone HscB
MNYFELYDIPESLQPDKNVVKQKFYQLSRQYHPDFYTQQTEGEQADSLEMSSLINKAFKVFQNPDATIKYVLQIKGLLEEEEKYELTPDFLMEVMELNEQLMDAKIEDDKAAIEKVKAGINTLQAEIFEPVKTIVETYTEGATPTEDLLKVKEYYFKKKYLNRILAGIS